MGGHVRTRIIGRFFFEDENGNVMTVTKERILEVLRKFWTAMGHRNRVRDPNIFQRDEQWLQQDGATTHTAIVILACLDEKFPDRLISRRHGPEWALHAPDINPPDF